MPKFEGTVEDIVFRNDQNGWKVASVRLDGSGRISAVGVMPFLSTGEHVIFDGELVERILAPGEQLVVDTGNVAGFEGTVNMTIQKVSGVKNALLGGEGLFNTLLTGPGKVWLQTMPIVNVANAIRPYIPTKSD